MDEVSEYLRQSLNQAIVGEIRNNNRDRLMTLPNFDMAAFSASFYAPGDVIIVPGDEGGQENSTGTEVCRLCLCRDKKLYELSPQIQVAYQCALSQDVNENDEKLPQKFCWDCNARMTSFTFFRMKAIQTNTLLYSLIRPFMSVSELTSTRRQRRAAGLLANPACIIHRQSRTVPYNIPTDAQDGLPRRSSGSAKTGKFILRDTSSFIVSALFWWLPLLILAFRR